MVVTFFGEIIFEIKHKKTMNKEKNCHLLLPDDTYNSCTIIVFK